MANTFNKTTWVDNSAPAITAAQLNRIENGIDAVNTLANALETQEAKDFHLNMGTAITAQSNLNTYTTPGTYYCASAAIAAGLTNSPITNRGFKMVVLTQGYSDLSYGAQIIYASLGDSVSAGYNAIYMRSYWGSSGWTEWSRVALSSGSGSVNANGESIPSGADLNNYKTPGNYYSANGTISASLSNAPSVSAGFRLEVKTTIALTVMVQIVYYSLDPTRIFVRAFTTGSGWTNWERLARADELPAYATASISVTLGDVTTTATVRKYGRIATLVVSIGSTTGMPFSGISDNPTIGTLPSGFRPQGATAYNVGTARTEGGWATATYYPIHLSILTDGTMKIQGTSANIKTCKYVNVSITYITE